MEEKRVKIETPDGKMETFVAHPSSGGPFPAVIMFQNVGGQSEVLCDLARRVASAGYYCAVPALYYRLGKIVIDPDSSDERVLAIRRIASDSLVNAKVVEDTCSLLDYIKGDPCARPGAMGTVGFCMGGRFAIVAAGHFPERIKATASLFGAKLVTNQPDSPHLLLNRLQGELYCGFAEFDKSAPPDTVRQIAELLKTCSVQSLVETHAGSKHGYVFPGRIPYHREAAERSWDRIFAMYQRQIPV